MQIDLHRAWEQVTQTLDTLLQVVAHRHDLHVAEGMVVQIPVDIDPQGQARELGVRHVQIQGEVQADPQRGVEAAQRAQVPVSEAPDHDIQV